MYQFLSAICIVYTAIGVHHISSRYSIARPRNGLVLFAAPEAIIPTRGDLQMGYSVPSLKHRMTSIKIHT